MGKALIGSVIDFPTAYTLAPSGSDFVSLNMGSLANGSTTESRISEEVRLAGTLSRLSARVVANSLSTAATTIRSRIDSANGNQVLSISAGATGYFADTSNTDAVVDGNNINMSLAVAAGGTGTIELSGLVMNFSATTNHATLLGSQSGSGASFNGASTTEFVALSGLLTDSISTEANVQNQIDIAGTLSKGQVIILSNGRSSTTTFRTRINGANGNISMAVTAGGTGTFEDTSNTDTIAANDLVNISASMGTGTGNCNATLVTVGFVNSTNAKANVFASTTTGLSRTASATTHFLPIIGRIGVTSETVEASCKLDIGFTATASNLKIFVSANTYTGAATYKSRKNGADGSQSVSITAGGTGVFEDTSNSDSLSATDDFCTAIVGGTANSITIQWTGMLLEDTTTPATSIKTINGLAIASVKTVNGLAIASVKTVNGLA